MFENIFWHGWGFIGSALSFLAYMVVWMTSQKPFSKTAFYRIKIYEFLSLFFIFLWVAYFIFVEYSISILTEGNIYEIGKATSK